MEEVQVLSANRDMWQGCEGLNYRRWGYVAGMEERATSSAGGVYVEREGKSPIFYVGEQVVSCKPEGNVPSGFWVLAYSLSSSQCHLFSRAQGPELCPIVDVDQRLILNMHDHVRFAVAIYILKISGYGCQVLSIAKKGRAVVDTRL